MITQCEVTLNTVATERDVTVEERPRCSRVFGLARFLRLFCL